MGDIATLQQHDKSIKRIGKSRPFRLRIVDSEVCRRQRQQFFNCDGYFTGVPTFCVEMPR